MRELRTTVPKENQETVMNYLLFENLIYCRIKRKLQWSSLEWMMEVIDT